MTDRYLNKESLEEFITDNFKSKKDFVDEWGVSYSHFLKMINREGRIGSKSIKRLEILLNDYGWSIEDVLEPTPIIIGDMEVLEIIVTDNDDNLIASITSRNEIVDKKYKVEYIQRLREGITK